MGVAGFGHSLKASWGKEATYGTAVARVEVIDVLSESIVPAIDNIESGALNTPGIKTARVTAGHQAYAGDIVFEAGYKDWELLLEAAMGTVSSALTNGAAYTHTFTLADALPTGLTVEVYRDTSSFTGADDDLAHIYKGGKVNTISFEAALDAFLRVTAGFVFQDEARGAKTATAYSTANIATFLQGVLKWGGGTVATDVESFTLALNNNLQVDKRRLSYDTIREPVRGGKIEVTGSFVSDFDSFGMYDDFRNATARNLTMTFTGGNISNSNQTETITFSVYNVRVTDHSVVSDDPGQYTQDVSFKAYRDGTNNEFKVEMINNNTAA